MPLISTRALTKRYPGVTALDGLSLELEPGVIGLVGANGAGKSTLIKILLGLLPATDGEARVLDLDAATQAQLNRGARLVEILKQRQYNPLPVEKQVLIIYAGTNGYIDQVPVGDVGAYESDLYQFFELRYSSFLATVAEKKQIDDELKGQLNAALKEFGQQFAAARKAA